MRYVRLNLLLLLCTALNCGATSFSTDISDLWWNPAESGWGVNVIQQDNILFLTLFAYSSGGQAGWYVGPDVTFASVDAAGARTFTGPWYQTTGPYFGGPFNPATVTVRQVGTATFTLLNATTARFVYSVDGVNVTKDLTRQTWKTNAIGGAFLGGRVGNYSGCTDGSANGYRQEDGNLSILQLGSAVTIFLTGAESCTYNGSYSQLGRMGSLSGTFSCNTGTSGNFSATELEAGVSGLTMRATMQSSVCQWSGRMGGLRTGPAGL